MMPWRTIPVLAIEAAFAAKPVPEIVTQKPAVQATDRHIATKHNGRAWRDEEQMQKQFSNWLSSLRRDKVVGEGVTLHGLRVTYAAGLKRDAFERGEAIDNSGVAAALRDRDERMGGHYTRHVENEIKGNLAFRQAAEEEKVNRFGKQEGSDGKSYVECAISIGFFIASPE
jgi:hypothetical protein